MRRHLLPLAALALLGVPTSTSAQPLADTVGVVSAGIRALDDHHRGRIRALVTDVATIPQIGDTVPVARFSPEGVRGLQAAVPRLRVCTRGREGACGGVSGILEVLAAAPEFTSADSARIVLAFETRQNVLVVRFWLARDGEGWTPYRGVILADAHFDYRRREPAPPPAARARPAARRPDPRGRDDAPLAAGRQLLEVVGADIAQLCVKESCRNVYVDVESFRRGIAPLDVTFSRDSLAAWLGFPFVDLPTADAYRCGTWQPVDRCDIAHRGTHLRLDSVWREGSFLHLRSMHTRFRGRVRPGPRHPAHEKMLFVYVRDDDAWLPFRSEAQY